MRGKQELVKLVHHLCEEVRAVVRPMLGHPLAKDVGRQGATGDTTFGIDQVAEGRIAEILDEVGDIAYYTEDRGLVVSGSPEYLLVIDPVDGTRPAAAGLESCCVSVAVSNFHAGEVGLLTLGDVFLGVVSEIKNRAVFTAFREGGVEIELDGRVVGATPSCASELSRIFWTMGFRGRPAEPLITVLSELIDLTSVDGGVFDLGSATFCIIRVVTGEMDAYVDVGQRMVDEIERVRGMFLEVGHGAILNNYPYDLAAAALIATENGAVVTDAYGRSLDDYPLVPSQGGGQISSLVASNTELHRALLERVNRGMERLHRRYPPNERG